MFSCSCTSFEFWYTEVTKTTSASVGACGTMSVTHLEETRKTLQYSWLVSIVHVGHAGIPNDGGDVVFGSERAILWGHPPGEALDAGR